MVIQGHSGHLPSFSSFLTPSPWPLTWERQCRIIPGKVLWVRPGSGICHFCLHSVSWTLVVAGVAGKLISLSVGKEEFMDLVSI